jgi:hypothetical protein
VGFGGVATFRAAGAAWPKPGRPALFRRLIRYSRCAHRSGSLAFPASSFALAAATTEPRGLGGRPGPDVRGLPERTRRSIARSPAPLVVFATSSEHPLRPGRSGPGPKSDAASRLSWDSSAPLHRRTFARPHRGHRLAPAPGVPRSHPRDTFRPRGFAPPRRFSPREGRGLVASRCRSWGSSRLSRRTAQQAARPTRPRDAVHTPRRIPLASSRTVSPRPLPPCGSVVARARSRLQAAGRDRATPPGWAPVHRSRPPHTDRKTPATPRRCRRVVRGSGPLRGLAPPANP